MSTPMGFQCGRVNSALPGCGRRRKSPLPLVTFKIVVAIHWEALRLWLKGAAGYPSCCRRREYHLGGRQTQ